MDPQTSSTSNSTTETQLTTVDEWLAVGTLGFIWCVCLPICVFSYRSFHSHRFKTYFEKRRIILINALFIMIFLALFVCTTMSLIVLILTVEDVFATQKSSRFFGALGDDIRGVVLMSVIFLLLGRCWILYYDHKLEHSKAKNNWRSILNENYENWFEKHGAKYGNLKFVFTILIIIDIICCTIYIILRHLSAEWNLLDYRIYTFWLILIIVLTFIAVSIIFSKFPEFTDLFSIKHELLWITRIGVFGGILGGALTALYFVLDNIDTTFFAALIEIYFYTSIAFVISFYVVKQNKTKLKRYNTQKLFNIVDQIEEQERKTKEKQREMSDMIRRAATSMVESTQEMSKSNVARQKTNEKKAINEDKDDDDHNNNNNNNNNETETDDDTGTDSGNVSDIISPRDQKDDKRLVQDMETRESWQDFVGHKIGYEAFMLFLGKEFSTENLLFVTEYMQLKKELKLTKIRKYKHLYPFSIQLPRTIPISQIVCEFADSTKIPKEQQTKDQQMRDDAVDNLKKRLNNMRNRAFSNNENNNSNKSSSGAASGAASGRATEEEAITRLPTESATSVRSVSQMVADASPQSPSLPMTSTKLFGQSSLSTSIVGRKASVGAPMIDEKELNLKKVRAFRIATEKLYKKYLETKHAPFEVNISASARNEIAKLFRGDKPAERKTSILIVSKFRLSLQLQPNQHIFNIAPKQKSNDSGNNNVEMGAIDEMKNGGASDTDLPNLSSKEKEMHNDDGGGDDEDFNDLIATFIPKFDAAATEISKLMNDSFGRFCLTKDYANLKIQLTTDALKVEPVFGTFSRKNTDQFES